MFSEDPRKSGRFSGLEYPDLGREGQLFGSIRRVNGELAQLARAPALHAGGQGFDSLILHNLISEFGIVILDF
jgi:hypothetical protein